LGLTTPTHAEAQDAPAEVTYRQNLMQAIRTNVLQLRAVESVSQPTHTVHYARALYGLGEMLGEAFEDGSPASSRSLPAIWQNRAGYAERVAAFQAATAQLLEAAEMRNPAGVAAAMEGVGGTCGACHETFRAPS
jgi:cytochrome c556